MVEAFDFKSLPFPYLESQRPQLLQYKELAVRKERKIALKKRERVEWLNEYVANRLRAWEDSKRKTNTNKIQSVKGENVVTQFSPLQSGCRGNRDNGEEIQNVKPETYPVVEKKETPSPQSSPSLSPSSPSRNSPPSFFHSPSPSPPRSLLSSSPRFLVRVHQAGDYAPHQKPVQLVNQGAPVPPLTLHQPVHRPDKPVSKPVPDRQKPVELVREREKKDRMILGGLVRGYLTRRLMRTEKVKELITIIKDAEIVLNSLTNQSKVVNVHEMDLQERVTQQLQTAKHKIHSIFFVLSPAERMKYIAQSRLIKLEKKFKQAKEEMNRPLRLSSATMKSLERKHSNQHITGGGTLGPPVRMHSCFTPHSPLPLITTKEVTTHRQSETPTQSIDSALGGSKDDGDATSIPCSSTASSDARAFTATATTRATRPAITSTGASSATRINTAPDRSVSGSGGTMTKSNSHKITVFKSSSRPKGSSPVRAKVVTGVAGRKMAGTQQNPPTAYGRGEGRRGGSGGRGRGGSGGRGRGGTGERKRGAARGRWHQLKT